MAYAAARALKAGDEPEYARDSKTCKADKDIVGDTDEQEYAELY